jgi:hypothetical protein
MDRTVGVTRRASAGEAHAFPRARAKQRQHGWSPCAQGKWSVRIQAIGGGATWSGRANVWTQGTSSKAKDEVGCIPKLVCSSLCVLPLQFYGANLSFGRITPFNLFSPTK